MQAFHLIKKPLLLFLLLLIVGCGSTRTEINPASGELSQVWTLDPSVTNSLAIVKNVGEAVPGPVGWLASLVGGIGLAAAEIVRRKKNRELKDERELVLAIVDGVERSAIPEVKEFIRKTAEARDKESALKGVLVDRGYRKKNKL